MSKAIWLVITWNQIIKIGKTNKIDMKVLKLSQNLELVGSLKSVSNWKRKVAEKSSLHAQSASSSSSSASGSSSWSCSYSSMVLSLSPSLQRLMVRPPRSPSSSLPLRPSLCLYISFAFSLSISPPSPSLSLSAHPSARPSLSSSTHFMQRWGYLRDSASMEKISSGTMNRLSVGTSGREGSGGGGPSDEWGPMVGCRCMRAGVERGGGRRRRRRRW